MAKRQCRIRKSKKKKLPKKKISSKKQKKGVKKRKFVLRSKKTGRISFLTFWVGLIIGLGTIFLFWSTLSIVRPALAFSSSDNSQIINQSLEIQSLNLNKIEKEPSNTAMTNLYIRIIPSRRLVVDKEENIKEIYSNNGEAKEDFKLFASYETSGNNEIPLTTKILEQYNKLEPKIDWSKRGLVWKK